MREELGSSKLEIANLSVPAACLDCLQPLALCLWAGFNFFCLAVHSVLSCAVLDSAELSCQEHQRAVESELQAKAAAAKDALKVLACDILTRSLLSMTSASACPSPWQE